MFEAAVMSWSRTTCQDDAMYSSMIKHIPDKFNDMKSWSDSFRYHVSEDMRASIKSDLELIDAKILRKTIFTVETNDNGKRIIVIKNKKLKLPRVILVLLVQRPGVSEKSKFAIMKSDNSEQSSSRDFLLTPDSDEILKQIQHQKAEESENNWSLFLLTATLIPSMRICDGLLASSKLPMSSLLREMLSCSPSKPVTSIKTLLPLPPDTLKLMKELNESQKNAVKSVINIVLSAAKDGSHLQVIRGPPGTGKTNTLATLIVATLYQSYLPNTSNRLHVSAPTNQAIVELTKRSLKNIQKQAASGMVIKCKSRHILLIGNREKLDITSDLEDVFLDARLERVSEGLAGWLSNMGALKYQMSQKTESASASDAMKCLRILDASIRCGTAIAQDLPDQYIEESDRKHMKKIVGTLRGYRTMLKKKDATYNYNFNRSLIENQLKSQDSSNVFQICVKFLKLKRNDREDAIINDARVVFSTVSSGGRPVFEKQCFDMVIIDEATQLVEAETSIMLSANLKCLVLAGDNKQLPSTVISKLAETHGYGRSLFDRLLHHNFPSLLLNIQYRMHPDISIWPNREFYNGEIKDGENVRSKAYSKYWHDILPPFSVRDVVGEDKKSPTGSRYNNEEAKAILKIIADLSKLIGTKVKSQDGQEPLIVGILFPYKAQCELIERMSKYITNKSRKLMSIICRTIDGFQGQECDIIILSTVRSNEGGFLGFVSDCRRLNVAVTRPKYSLLLVGNCTTLRTDKVWTRLLQPRDHIKTKKQSSELSPTQTVVGTDVTVSFTSKNGNTIKCKKSHITDLFQALSL